MASRSPSASRLSPEERIGLGVALAAHLALFGWLAFDQPGRDLVPPPERMTVSFAEEVAPQSTAPAPMTEAAPEVAPTRGEAVSEPEPEPLPVARPEPVIQPQTLPRVIPTPQPRPVPKAAPRAVPKTVPTRTPPKAPPPTKPVAKSVAKPVDKAAAKPAPKAALKAASGAKPADERARRRPDTPQGASRLGNDFLKGLPGGQVAGAATTPPAAKAGPQVAASLSQAIARQLKPRWVAPQGAEADALVTILAWDLARDGSLAGRPRVVSQSGVTDANRTQQARHAEQAIRAVQLAAPFDLPEQYYDSWKRVSSFRFDRKLSQ